MARYRQVLSYKPAATLPCYTVALVREGTGPADAIEEVNIGGESDVREVCADLMHAPNERFLVLLLNTKNRLLARVEVSHGSLNASIVHPREVFKLAVAANAASVVLVHNHPSGDTTPSGADIQLTRRLVKAGDVLGIEVLDHVIIGHVETGGGRVARSFSLRGGGLM